MQFQQASLNILIEKLFYCKCSKFSFYKFNLLPKLQRVQQCGRKFNFIAELNTIKLINNYAKVMELMDFYLQRQDKKIIISLQLSMSAL